MPLQLRMEAIGMVASDIDTARALEELNASRGSDRESVHEALAQAKLAMEYSLNYFYFCYWLFLQRRQPALFAICFVRMQRHRSFQEIGHVAENMRLLVLQLVSAS